MPLPTADLDWMYKESGGVVLRATGIPKTYVHLESIDVTMFQGSHLEVKGVTHTATGEYSKLSALAIGDTVTVDGDDYVIRDRQRLGDGQDIQLLLKEA